MTDHTTTDEKTAHGGNGTQSLDEFDLAEVALGHLDELASLLGRGLDELAAEEGAYITAILTERAEPAERPHIYDSVKEAIIGLPDEHQFLAYAYCQITPDNPDLLGNLAKEAGAEDSPDDDQPNLQFIPDIPIINPALDFAKGIVYIAQQMTLAGGDDGSTIKSVPIVFTSNRQTFIPPVVKEANEIKLLGNHVAIDKSLEMSARRWSLPAIQSWLDQCDKPDLDPLTLYRQLLALYRKRVWFADDYDYLIFALYTMLSYVYPVFDAIPYLHLSGLAGSGKTHAARLLATLAFNGHIEVDPTEASLFRTIEATRGLVVLDDQETGVTNRSHSDNPFMTILKVGYKRGGVVTRMERRGANFVPLCFDVYCPKVITNVFGLEDILSDRTIPILMREIPSNLVNKFDTSPLTARQSQPIVDKLFLFAMLHTAHLAELASEPVSHRGRNEEIFWPLLTLATYIDTFGDESSLLSELASALDEKTGQRGVIKDTTPEQALRLALMNLLEMRSVHEDWFTSREIEIEFYKLHSSPPAWYNDRWLGRNIGKVINLRPQDRRRQSHDSRVYRFDYRTGQELDELETKRFTEYFIRREAL